MGISSDSAAFRHSEGRKVRVWAKSGTARRFQQSYHLDGEQIEVQFPEGSVSAKDTGCDGNGAMTSWLVN